MTRKYDRHIFVSSRLRSILSNKWIVDIIFPLVMGSHVHNEQG